MEKIAMKCNSKQFKHIKPKLKEAGIDIFMISEFKEGSYLCFFSDKFVTNGVIQFRNIYAKIYDEWNEETFLKICGIKPKEKTYKIKQETGMDSITINDVKYIKEDKDSYKITREQLEQLHMQGNDYTKFDIEYLFPEVFETKLTVGKWYKFKYENYNKFLGCITKIEGDTFFYYGFNTGGRYVKNDCYEIDGTETEATEQEVTEALTKEAVRIGYKEGDYVRYTWFNIDNGVYKPTLNGGITYNSKDNCLYIGETRVFNNGKWAEIIPTITIQEAEAKLNCKIV